METPLVTSADSENTVDHHRTHSSSFDETLPAPKSKKAIKAKKAKLRAAALLVKGPDAERDDIRGVEEVSQYSEDWEVWDESYPARGNKLSAHPSSSSYRSHSTAAPTSSTPHHDFHLLNGYRHVAEVSSPPPSGAGRGGSPPGSAAAPGNISLSRGPMSTGSVRTPLPLKHITSITTLGDPQVQSITSLSRKNVLPLRSPLEGASHDPISVSDDGRGPVSVMSDQCGRILGTNDGSVRGTELRGLREGEKVLEECSVGSAGETDRCAKQQNEGSPKSDRSKKAHAKPLQRIVPSDGLGTACNTERIRAPLHSPRGPGSGSGIGADGRFQSNSQCRILGIRPLIWNCKSLRPCPHPRHLRPAHPRSSPSTRTMCPVMGANTGTLYGLRGRCR